MATSPDTRRALVTGSARGIGRAIGFALDEAGFDVLGVDRRPQDQGPFRAVLEADLADPAAIVRLGEEVGNIDVLVNNAAVLVSRPFLETSIADFDLVVAVNLRAPFLLSQAFVGRMAERGWGRIINVSSIAARTGGRSNVSAYAASKAGLIALTKAMAREFGPAGVTVNAVAPGAIDTAMSADLSEDLRERFIQEIPLRRFAPPTTVAGVVAFLASEEAEWITGATVDVNGGWVMA